MTIDGPNTPPLPPDPIENDVVNIFPMARKNKKGMVSSLSSAFWANPYPNARV
jgi:hypothetical protein